MWKNVTYCRKVYCTTNQEPSSPSTQVWKKNWVKDFRFRYKKIFQKWSVEGWSDGWADGRGGWFSEDRMDGRLWKEGYSVGEWPRNLSDFVHNFQHHKKFWIVKEYSRLQSLLSKWNTLFAVCHSLMITNHKSPPSLSSILEADGKDRLFPPPSYFAATISYNCHCVEHTKYPGNRQAGRSTVPGCSHSNFAASILYRCWNSLVHSKKNWNYSSIFLDLVCNWKLQASLSGCKVNICQVTPSQSSGLGSRKLGWKFNEDFSKVENKKVVESAGMKEN